MKHTAIKNPAYQLLAVISCVLLFIGFLYVRIARASSPIQLNITASDHIQGSPDAPIAIYEFSDFECPFCKDHHETLSELIKKYPEKIVWVYKHFPLSMHPHGQEKAEASECVAEYAGNTGFWTFAELLFTSGTETPLSDLPALAKKAGVKSVDFNSCITSSRHTQKVATDQKLGTFLGVQGTPGNIIVNTRTGERKFISGALSIDQLTPIIEGML
jgi:protein-disulfide isomerase